MAPSFFALTPCARVARGRRLVLRLSLLLTAAGAPGCLGGQTGQESESAPQCEREVVSAGETTPLGFGPTEVLRTTEPPLVEPVRFFQLEGASELSLTLSGVREARFATSHQQLGDCPDRLELDVTVRLRTSNGAFDETFPATVLATGPMSFTLSGELPLADVMGGYDGAELDLEVWREPFLQIHARLEDGAFSGGIWLTGADPSPNDGTLPTSSYVAEWPAP